MFHTGILSFGAFTSFYIAMRLALRSIRMHTRLSEEDDQNADNDESPDADNHQSPNDNHQSPNFE